jgi:hypothetical protein
MSDNKQAASRRTVSHTLRNGKTIHLSTLGFKDFASMQAQCLSEKRRDTLLMWSENADLIPDDMREKKLDEAFAKAESMTYESLPKKLMEVPARDAKTGLLLRDDVNEIIMEKVLVDYMEWWAVSTYQGVLFSTLRGMHHTESQRHYTEDNADELFLDRPELDRVHDLVGEVTKSKLDLAGNSTAPQEAGTNGKTETRRERRRRRRRGH